MDNSIPTDDTAAAGDGLDVARLRLARLRQELKVRDFDACVLYDPVNLRFATGARNMQVFLLRNPARYVFIPADGSVILFEFQGAEHLARDLTTIDEIRPAVTWSYVAAGPRVNEFASLWATEIADLMRTHCGQSSRRLAVDNLNPPGLAALARHGIEVFDAQEAVEHAKAIKSEQEVEVMKTSIATTERAVACMREALTPQMTENELWAVLHGELIARDGEYIETRLLSSGRRTNPWFQETSERVINAGDLVCLDTDIVGPSGMYTDFSRTFFCEPGTPSDEQRRLYALAVEQVSHNMELLRPGSTFREISEKSWRIPDACVENRYFCVAHGVGLTGEYPYIFHPQDFAKSGYDGVLEENMTMCVESYIGPTGATEGVKLEQQVLIGKEGPELLSSYPLESELL
jgi:Xaa-Pro dipeptidase